MDNYFLHYTKYHRVNTQLPINRYHFHIAIVNLILLMIVLVVCGAVD